LLHWLLKYLKAKMWGINLTVGLLQWHNIPASRTSPNHLIEWKRHREWYGDSLNDQITSTQLHSISCQLERW
jgi:hypothetical protein